MADESLSIDEVARIAIEQRNQARADLEGANRLIELCIEQRETAYAQIKRNRLEYEVDRDRYRKGFCPNVFGHQMYLNPRDSGMALGSLEGQDVHSFQGEIGFFKRTINAGYRVLDLGANVGLFTLLFARSVGLIGRVYAFEPGPISSCLLQANVRLNGYHHNVIVENAAVTDKSGEVMLCVAHGESDNRIEAAIRTADDTEQMTVRALALDDYFSRETVDVIKMDIQGAEFLALKGMEKLLARSGGVQVVMEYMPASFHDPAGLLAYLEELNFKLHVLPENGIEISMTATQLLDTVGPGRPEHMVNLVLRRF